MIAYWNRDNSKSAIFELSKHSGVEHMGDSQKQGRQKIRPNNINGQNTARITVKIAPQI